MVYTNFPNGITSLGIPIVGSGPTIPVTSGNYWWVNSATGNTGGPGTIDQPYSTLNAAIGVAGVNDVIIIAAGHTETISAAGGVTVNVAGVQIVGLGVGAKRPTFTFTTSTAATFLISAASVSVVNIIGTTTVDQIVSPFSVTAANVTLGTANYPVEWQDGSSVLESLRAVLTNATASNFRCSLKYIGFPAGSHCVNAIRLVGAANAILNVDLYGKASTAWVEFVTTACTDVEVYGYM